MTSSATACDLLLLGHHQPNHRPFFPHVVAIILGFLIGCHVAQGATRGRVIQWPSYYAAQVPQAARQGVVAVAAGLHFYMALKEDGSLVVWTYPGGTHLNYPSALTNVPAEARTGVKAIAAGAYHALVLKTNGTVVSWGYTLAAMT